MDRVRAYQSATRMDAERDPTPARCREAARADEAVRLLEGPGLWARFWQWLLG